MIIEYIRKFGKANKKNIRALLIDKLPDALDEKQKENKIRNILTALKKEGKIITDSPNQQKANWIIVE